MAQRTAVILVVGLTEKVLAGMPRAGAFAKAGIVRHLRPVFPAVTCPVQSSMLTGAPVSEHGIVANGWHDRELGEVQFWKQSNRLVGAEKVWETARRRDPSVTTANICWWFNMNTTADVAVTPRPIYAADGRKFPDCYTAPAELRDRLQAELGAFPLFQFWGPAASIVSSRWIAEASKRVASWHSPTISLVYLPHLDYALQRSGPEGPEAVAAAAELDAVLGELIDFYRARATRVMLVSEYGIEPVSSPVYPNRALRQAGLLQVRTERGGELLDAAASRAFAVCDHQCAHVYVRDARDVPQVSEVLRVLRGVEKIVDASGQREMDVAHARSGELMLAAAGGSWFAYPYWLNDAAAPDFARTVDIHRKPGYDPCELLLDPAIRFPKLTIGRKLLARKLGFRASMDVIPLDASLVKGSHGRVDAAPADRPVVVAESRFLERSGGDVIPCQAIRDLILDHVFG